MSDAPTLDDQVRLLVALQDLDQMIREVEDQDTSAELEKLGFSLDGMEELKAARDRLGDVYFPPLLIAGLLGFVAAWLSAQLLNRYQRVSKNYGRTIVPVINELCTGCFAKVPTSFRYEKNTVMTCENCGRILYFA